MNRREFVCRSILAVTLPLPVVAQSTERVYRIGFLSRGAPSPATSHLTDTFREALRGLGYTEGRNLAIEWGWADGRNERLADLAPRFARVPVDVIVAQGTLETRAAKQVTSTIAIVMVNVGDPVGAGFVDSLPRPGGNITGLSFLFPELSVKQLELFRTALPGTTRFVVFWNPGNPSHAPALRALQAAARQLDVELWPLETRTDGDLNSAFRKIIEDRHRALFVLGEPKVFRQRVRLAKLAMRHHIATIFNLREHTEAGGLMSYGVDFHDLHRRAAGYVDRLLKGVKPRDLPVERPTKFELVINLKTARALGLTIPPSLLVRADQVIE
jgi:putative ABC transport system substrate-binding protein